VLLVWQGTEGSYSIENRITSWQCAAKTGCFINIFYLKFANQNIVQCCLRARKITCKVLGVDRLVVLWVAEGQILPFRIDFRRRPYNELTLLPYQLCDTNSYAYSHRCRANEIRHYARRRKWREYRASRTIVRRAVNWFRNLLPVPRLSAVTEISQIGLKFLRTGSIFGHLWPYFDCACTEAAI